MTHPNWIWAEKCPWCHNAINLHSDWEANNYTSDIFEVECEYCEEKISVLPESVIEFAVKKKDENDE